MTNHRTDPTASRRTAIAGLAAGGLGFGLAARSSPALAQEPGGDLAGHPLAGTWAAITPDGVVPQTHHADGSFIAAFPPNYIDPGLGLTFQGPALGQWESTGARTGRFMFIQALADAAGVYVGTFQLAADIEASEDGQAWSGTSGTNAARYIMRDAANTILMDEVFALDPPVTGIRLGATIESVVLPVSAPEAGTPAP